MKRNLFILQKRYLYGLILMLFFTACYEFSFVNQPGSAEINSTFQVQISAYTTDGDGQYYTPYFGVKLPEGWQVDDSIVFSYGTTIGWFVHSDSLSQAMSAIDPPPPGYFWWVGQVIDLVLYNYGDTYLLNPVIHTGDQTGNFSLDYMLGHDYIYYGYGGLNFRRSNGHSITVGLPDHVVVTGNSDHGLGSLRSAIAHVDFNGTITFQMVNPAPIVLETPLEINKNITIRGSDDMPVVISGNDQCQVFIVGENYSPKFEFIDIMQGHGYNGGGAECRAGSSPVFSNCSFSGNSAVQSGGGLYAGYGTNPVMTDLVFSGNSANEGGGVYLQYSGVASMHNMAFTDNTANYSGGAVYSSSETLEMRDIMISSNHSQYYGGGLYLYNGEVNARNLSVVSNTVDGPEGAGGGIYTEYGSIVLENSVISKNISNGRGGGISFGYDSNPEFCCTARCDIFDNEAAEGSDLYAQTLVDVIVDRFTVLYPNNLHASPFENFTFDILHGVNAQVDADLYISPRGDNQNSGLSPDMPKRTISGALSILSTQKQHTLYLDKGEYSVSSNGERFPVILPDHINLEGHPEFATVLDATGKSEAIRINHATQVSISGITITGASQRAVSCDNSSPAIRNVVITRNDGTGFYCSNNSAPVLNGVNISRNGGGGIQCYNSSIRIFNSGIGNNKAYSGAGVYLSNSGAYFRNVNIMENEVPGGWYSGSGGGVCCINSDPVFIESAISNNVSGKEGGGIYCYESKLYMAKTELKGNRGAVGGGLYLDQSGVTLLNVEFSGNSANMAGGAYFKRSEADLTNVLVTGNAAGNGAGLYFRESEGLMKNVTITENIAKISGGAVFNYRTNLSLWNSVLWGNFPEEIVHFTTSGSPSQLGIYYSDVMGGQEGIDMHGPGLVDWGTGCLDADPLFTGSGIDPFSLAHHSPCIDAGPRSPDWLGLPPYDIRGNERILDGDQNSLAIVDMGAYEFENIPVEPKNMIAGAGGEYGFSVYPNPCRDVAFFSYTLPAESRISIVIYNQLGKQVAVLADASQKAGQYLVRWNSPEAGPGVYMYRIQAGKTVVGGKLIKQ
ncbi:right-handed parallel beta-helix repeat-containing protein [Lentimicrobium saccharophilum]|nr:right-handed parallel beta-helix repeat-containing protein [Lentimicrobium saccharophilum]